MRRAVPSRGGWQSAELLPGLLGLLLHLRDVPRKTAIKESQFRLPTAFPTYNAYINLNQRSDARIGARITATPESSSRLAPDERVRIEPSGKGIFVKPRLVCHGAVVDLTNQLGGSLTPQEREAQGLE
jgi:hypothetical protein